MEYHPGHPGMSSPELGMFFVLKYLAAWILSGLNSVLPKFMSTSECDFVWK